MKNEILEKAGRVIQENKELITAELKCKPLVGAVGGSVSLNLTNTSSDIDFYLVTEEQEGEDILRTVFLDGVKVDFMCVTLNVLFKECERYFNLEHKYPTRFYRSQIEMDDIISKQDIERVDFKREMIIRIFLADEIFEFKKDEVEIVYNKLKRGLRLIDVWDYHFSRAYGNYYEKVKGKEKVLLRKYLYIISQITICTMLLQNNKAVMNYLQMFEKPHCVYENEEIIDICRRLWKENFQSKIKKNKNYIVSESKLNQWIEENLDKVLYSMKENKNVLEKKFFLYDESKIRKIY